MVAKAHAKYLRISPRKVKIVADLIRGKSVQQATAILMTTPKAASEPLLKLLNSAAANAENNHSMDPEQLYVSEIYATPGPIKVHTRETAGPNGGPLGADNPTIHAAAGWDWMPTVRGRNVGLG